MNLRYLFLAAGAFALSAPLVAADAEAESDAVRVQYDDLDLSTAAGRKELDQRVDKAARKVCGMDENNVGTRVPRKEARECYRDARQQLEARLAGLSGAGEVGA
jgi:UrcA family protein